MARQAVPQLWAWRVDRVLRRREDELESSEWPEFTASEDDSELLDTLRLDYSAEAERRKGLVEKARSGLFVVGVVIAVVMGITDFANEPLFGTSIKLFLVAGVLSLAMSAVCLSLAVVAWPWHGLYLDGVLTREGQVLSKKMQTTKDLVEEYYRHGKLNQIISTRISNLVSASYVGMRNGILLFSCFFIFLLFQPVGSSDRHHHSMAREVGAVDDITEYVERRHSEILDAVVVQEPGVEVPDPFRSYSTGQVRAGLVLYFEDKTFTLVSPEDTAILLNDGTLARLRIPLTLQSFVD